MIVYLDVSKESEELRDQLASRGLTQTILSTSLKDANKEIRKWRLEATLRQCQLDLKTGDSILEHKVTEKLDEEMENQRIELKQTKKGPNLACRKEERKMECTVKHKETSKLIVPGNIVTDHKEIITINDSVDDIPTIDLRDDLKQENVCIENQEVKKEEKPNLSTASSEFEDSKENIINIEGNDNVNKVTRVKEEPISNCDEATDNIEKKGQMFEEKENIPDSKTNSNKASRKVTFSQNTTSPKATDRSAMRTNCKRVAVPKPIYIPSE
ncbi:hypothetical protein NQ314_012651 [Rhamnusium bicolor]|uniref:Uncharacterized protein n=1 Tax=Rhamnusium bicolor TaxID=1586634 RepID=A0AAV8XB37_9CUCU|nr:hypothetical protein NQ314_012651 [Rhamnusium bicolor]